MKLYYCETPNPRKACALALHLGSPVELVRVDLGRGEHRSEQFAAINPNRKVPVLVDGDRTIWESNAIMCHLAIRDGSDLWPRGERQVEVLRWLSWGSEHFGWAGGELYFQHVIKPLIGQPIDPGAVAQATDEFRACAAVLDRHLADRMWLVDDALTIADFSVAMMLPYADAAHLPLAGFDHVERWHGEMNRLPAWRNPFPASAAAA